jgi:hypothetical protein
MLMLTVEQQRDHCAPPPSATLAARSTLAIPYLPKGAGVRWSTTLLVSSLASQSAQGAAGASRAGKGLKGGSLSCWSSIDRLLRESAAD